MPPKRRGLDRLGVRDLELDRIIPASIAKTRVPGCRAARRGKAEREIELFGHTADVWVTRRDKWMA
jgi:hypothetical protein